LICHAAILADFDLETSATRATPVSTSGNPREDSPMIYIDEPVES
jgi:hypothetical protein